MDIKLVASDLDGTIIDKNNNISPKNFEAIKLIKEKNIPFTICTGKSYSVAKKSCEKFTADYGIFGNGTQVVDLNKDTELQRNILKKDDLLYIATIAKRFNLHLHIYTESQVISETLQFLDLRNFILKTKYDFCDLEFKLVPDISEYIYNESPDVFSAVISSEESIDFFELYLNVNKNIAYNFNSKKGIYKDTIINKEYEYLNITPLHTNKDEALDFLTKMLNIDKKNVMAIGDNINDYEMVKNAGIGVAVNEAYDELKEVADYVTEATTSEGALSEAVKKYIK